VCPAARFRGGLRLAPLARLAGGRRFAAVRRLTLVRRLVAVRRLAVVRRFASGAALYLRPFFRVERLQRNCAVAQGTTAHTAAVGGSPQTHSANAAYRPKRRILWCPKAWSAMRLMPNLTAAPDR
jgi:hypothetical protein